VGIHLPPSEMSHGPTAPEARVRGMQVAGPCEFGCRLAPVAAVNGSITPVAVRLEEELGGVRPLLEDLRVLGIRLALLPQPGEGPGANDAQSRIVRQRGAVDQHLGLAVKELALQPVPPGERPVSGGAEVRRPGDGTLLVEVLGPTLD